MKIKVYTLIKAESENYGGGVEITSANFEKKNEAIEAGVDWVYRAAEKRNSNITDLLGKTAVMNTLREYESVDVPSNTGVTTVTLKEGII